MKRTVLVIASACLFSFTITVSDDLMKPMMEMMEKMSKMKMSGDFDNDFANMMYEHHQGAIDMSQVYLKSGKDESLRSMAKDGIAKQKEEQKKLKELSNGDGGQRTSGNHELMDDMQEMMNKMHASKMTDDIDKDFAHMMIIHHNGGIAMARKEQTNGKNSDLKKLVDKMIDDQQKDVVKLQNFAAR